MHSGLDLSKNLVLTYLSPISSPLKITSNPASPDETPTSLLHSTNNPTTTIPGVASSLSTGLQFSILLPENNQSKPTGELSHLVHFYLTFDPFFHVQITSNSRPTTLFWDVNIVVNTKIIAHAEQNDLDSINLYFTVSNQSSLHEK